jgi:anaerobic ribonucleoside-triphosphate reductase
MAECKCCGKELIDVCPICKKPVTVYSRVCGYLTPISTWNDGKQQEFKDRVDYTFAKDEPIKTDK